MAISSSSVADELERLSALHRSGVLTDTEFTAQKQKVLNPPPVETALPPQAAPAKRGRGWVYTLLSLAADR